MAKYGRRKTGTRTAAASKRGGRNKTKKSVVSHRGRAQLGGWPWDKKVATATTAEAPTNSPLRIGVGNLTGKGAGWPWDKNVATATTVATAEAPTNSPLRIGVGNLTGKGAGPKEAEGKFADAVRRGQLKSMDALDALDDALQYVLAAIRYANLHMISREDYRALLRALMVEERIWRMAEDHPQYNKWRGIVSWRRLAHLRSPHARRKARWLHEERRSLLTAYPEEDNNPMIYMDDAGEYVYLYA